MRTVMRLLDYWADAPPAHLLLGRVESVLIAIGEGAGVVKRVEQRPKGPPPAPSLEELQAFVAAVGGGMR